MTRMYDRPTLGPDGWIVDETPTPALLTWSLDSSGNPVGLVGPDGHAQRLAGIIDPTAALLCVGGDHCYDQWYGDANNGMGKLYRDYGIRPYMSINTAPGAGAPGESGFLSWDELKTIQSGGCEILSHGHRHVHQWGRNDTGMRVQYLGANGTATVHITGTPKTLTLDAEVAADASFDLTNASYDTLSELAAAINAVNGGASWRCTLAPELNGSERSVSLLTLSAARSVKTPGDAEYFCAGGGIILSYVGSAYESAFCEINSALGIYLDGVRRATFNLTNASYDTLSELVAAINALGVGGLTADLCNDTGGIYRHYLQGDETSSNLEQIVFRPITQTGGVVLDGAGKANGTRVSAGLPHSYILNRQFQASKDAAAAEGVELVNFAQSGGGLHQWHLTGQSQYRSFRTNSIERYHFPSHHWAALGPDYIRGHYSLSSSNTPKESVIAVLDAMADSPGCIVDLLMHAMVPATPAGKNGYTIQEPQAEALPYTMAEDDWIDCVVHIKSLMDQGSIVQVTPEQARRMRKFWSKPQNMVFNPKFRNDGTSILNSNSMTKVPGWELGTNVAHVTAADISDSKVVVTTNATTNAAIVGQVLTLEPGKTYRIGVRVEVTNYSSGTGVCCRVSPTTGRLANQQIDNTGPTWYSAWAQGDQDISMMVSIPRPGVQKPRVRGLVAGTFNISTGSTDTLSIAMDSYSAVVVTLTNGAARTAKQVADEINAAFTASATYTGRQEYWNVASAIGNKVVVQSPYAGESYWNRIVITGNGVATVFGYSQCLAMPVYCDMALAGLPVDFEVLSQMAGTFAVCQPYCVEVDLAY